MLVTLIEVAQSEYLALLLSKAMATLKTEDLVKNLTHTWFQRLLQLLQLASNNPLLKIIF
jgi:hypothetical protein